MKIIYGLDGRSRIVIDDKGMTDLIQSLGGHIELARALHLSRNQVWNWQERGIPWRWRPKVAELARKAKVPVPAEFLEPAA